MACKCKDIFSISEKKSKIHFITQITELIIKSSNLMKTLGFETSKIEGIVTIENKNPNVAFLFYWIDRIFHRIGGAIFWSKRA